MIKILLLRLAISMTVARDLAKEWKGMLNAKERKGTLRNAKKRYGMLRNVKEPKEH